MATYICIDLKSFFASVECVERGLDPFKTNLVVADTGRTQKTICLAVTPALKQYNIPGRVRLFEVEQKVKEINFNRRIKVFNHELKGESFDDDELKKNPNLSLTYIAAKPRMATYMQYSTQIYNIYLKYISDEDMYVYSIDEVFMDVTKYLNTYKLTAKELATKMIHEVFETTGITATAGIGTNMYLCKIAMDVVAKHTTADKNGVRMAELDEMSYRKLLWSHRPLTDFWRVGRGYAKKLEQNKIYTMGDIAEYSIKNEDFLYKLFGINTELLIDHAWGWEPTTIAQIKAYKPKNNSISTGQVLHCPYDYEKTKLIVKEMTDQLSLDLVRKHLVTDQLVLTIGYDIENVNDSYKGEITIDRYGRTIPKHAHGTENLQFQTSSSKIIGDAMLKLYDRIIDKNLLSRRITVVANHIIYEKNAEKTEQYEQIDLFSTLEKDETKDIKEKIEKEKNLQEVVIKMKEKYGKNAILKGMNFEEGGTAISRNSQIGGHSE